MSKPFYLRLYTYFSKIAETIKNDIKASEVFRNNSDKGSARELVYLNFLKQHLPSNCEVSLGGQLFDDDGEESSQIDILVTSNGSLKFDFLNKDTDGKSIRHVEGTIGAISVKSELDKKDLEDSLLGFSSIPAVKYLDSDRISDTYKITNYDDWPIKIIFAADGIKCETILAHISEFYKKNPIPINRRPNFIHVLGKYFIFRVDEHFTIHDPKTGIQVPITVPIGEYLAIKREPDIQCFFWTIIRLQETARASSQILLSYADMCTKLFSPEYAEELIV